MSKIRKIGDYKFATPTVADKFDYIYKKYLELPFDFSLQIITGTDQKKVTELFMEASISQNRNIRCITMIPRSTQEYYERIDDFKNNLLYVNDGNELYVFFKYPEVYLPIDEQQSYVYDCLMTAKEVLGNSFKTVRFFIATQSLFILSDCMTGNILFVNKPSDVQNSGNTDGFFGGNLYDLLIDYKVGSAISIMSNKIATQFIQKANNHEEIEDSVDFIGDRFIRGYLKR